METAGHSQYRQNAADTKIRVEPIQGGSTTMSIDGGNEGAHRHIEDTGAASRDDTRQQQGFIALRQGNQHQTHRADRHSGDGKQAYTEPISQGTGHYDAENNTGKHQRRDTAQLLLIQSAEINTEDSQVEWIKIDYNGDTNHTAMAEADKIRGFQRTPRTK